jgi:DNA repair protein RadC
LTWEIGGWVNIFVNHPLGDPEALEDNVKLPRRLTGTGKIKGVDVLGHIIVGDKKYLSLKREALF